MIELTHVSKDFGKGQQEVHAVRDVSLSIDKGEIFGIIGFSGAGKSTLVRCINLLERPTAGTVMVDNKDLTALSARELRQARKKIGMIFQHFNLMPSRTVAGNVAYSMRGSGLSRKETADKVARLLELVGIGDKANAYPSQLSGGQKQRVAIARALANEPPLILADEPTGNLDPQKSDEIMTLLEKIIYLADYIEPSRDFPGVNDLRACVYEDLDRGMLMGLEMTIDEMTEMGNPVHHATMEARDWLKGKR